MSSDKLGKYWLLAAFLLIVIIISSSLIIWIRRSPGQEIGILDPQPLQFSGQIFVEGAVNKPGIYPLKNEESLSSILQASGGVNDTADMSHIRLYVPPSQEVLQPQKVDINTADAWLLKALPDIGDIRAQAIIQYRVQNGLFHSISELTNVPGISKTTFEKIMNLITLTN